MEVEPLFWGIKSHFALPPDGNRHEPRAELRGQKLPALTSGQRRSNKSALSEKEATVNSAADFKSCADFLGDIPAFSLYAKEVLEEFVTHAPFRMHVAAGKKLYGQTRSDQNLYVVISGSASLDAGDGVCVTLGAGDYFGKTPGRSHGLMATVIAEEDVEVLVLRPEEVLELEMTASRHRHPSQIEWRGELASPAPRSPRRRQRALVAT